MYNLTPTEKGHLDQERENIQLTKIKDIDLLNDFEPENSNKKLYGNTAMIYTFKQKKKLTLIKLGDFRTVL